MASPVRDHLVGRLFPDHDLEPVVLVATGSMRVSPREDSVRVRAGSSRTPAVATGVGKGIDHDNAATPVAGTYPDETRLALLTHTEARETIEHLQLLEQLAPDERGQAAGQLAADLACRLPAP